MASYSISLHLSNSFSIIAARFFFAEIYKYEVIRKFTLKKIYIYIGIKIWQIHYLKIWKGLLYVRFGCPKKSYKNMSDTVITHFDLNFSKFYTFLLWFCPSYWMRHFLFQKMTGGIQKFMFLPKFWFVIRQRDNTIELKWLIGSLCSDQSITCISQRKKIVRQQSKMDLKGEG